MHKIKNQTRQGRTITKELATNILPFGNNNRVNALPLYMFYFDCIPNSICESKIELDLFLEAFHKNFSNLIENTHFNKETRHQTGFAVFENMYYKLKGAVLLYVDYNNKAVSLYFHGELSTEAAGIYELIKKSKIVIAHATPKIHILVHKHRLDLEELALKKCAVSIADHYNDDFALVDRTICKQLATPKDKGMVLLHGAPGTGKTHYIKYLMTHVTKKVIFIPPDMADQLTNPSLIGLFIEHPDAILVIEDAEKIIMNREVNGSSPVSAILNLSDGILSDCLNMQIICSFNTDVSNIDKALLRKGRLIANYEFCKLETGKANTLSRKLGFPTTFNEPQLLTDIFNQEEKQFAPPRKKTIGFY